MHKNIAFSDLFKNIAAGGKLGNELGLCVSVLTKFVVAFDPVSFHQVCKIKGAVDLVDKIHAQGELFHQEFQKLIVDPFFYFKSDRVTSLALFELLLDLLEKIFRLILGDIQIGASHDPVRTRTPDFIVDEETRQEPADDILKQNKSSRISFLSGKHEDPGEYAGHLHGGKLVFLLAGLGGLFGLLSGSENARGSRLFSCEKRSDIETLIADQREGP